MARNQIVDCKDNSKNYLPIRYLFSNKNMTFIFIQKNCSTSHKKIEIWLNTQQFCLDFYPIPYN